MINKIGEINKKAKSILTMIKLLNKFECKFEECYDDTERTHYFTIIEIHYLNDYRKIYQFREALKITVYELSNTIRIKINERIFNVDFKNHKQILDYYPVFIADFGETLNMKLTKKTLIKDFNSYDEFNDFLEIILPIII